MSVFGRTLYSVSEKFLSKLGSSANSSAWGLIEPHLSTAIRMYPRYIVTLQLRRFTVEPISSSWHWSDKPMSQRKPQCLCNHGRDQNSQMYSASTGDLLTETKACKQTIHTISSGKEHTARLISHETLFQCELDTTGIHPIKNSPFLKDLHHHVMPSCPRSEAFELYDWRLLIDAETRTHASKKSKVQSHNGLSVSISH